MNNKSKGFASMSAERRSEIARKGGIKVSSDKAHMAAIGRKGGLYHSREHMAEIGRKGGISNKGKQRKL